MIIVDMLLSAGGVVLEPAQSPAREVISPDVTLTLLTWLTFFLLVGILYKAAFQKILKNLDDREARIRRSLEEAEQIHAEYARLAEEREKKIHEARREAEQIIQEARRAAQNAARVIEQKAREEAQILRENAQRDMETAYAEALATLKKESAGWVTRLAGKVIEKELDDKEHAAFVKRLIHHL